MDASQYKDYILTLLFVKYVTDKFKVVKYADITVPEGGSFDDLVALKGNKNIGEKMDKVIAKLAEAGNNNLRGVIDNSLKNWTDGVKDYGGYGAEPPEKNGDFAWLLHILKSLKSTGKAAVILPHGILFRGNAEATIRVPILCDCQKQPII
jgi:type I restriction-modification system DNA methylase subunit